MRNIDLEIPRDSLVVFTGLSGSGKSSLAFDTIFAEGQRRYVESLSAYARQFLGQVDRPDVDFIEGLSPAVSIDQKSTNRNPRSTVGTITEIYDYMRLLWARIGIPHCAGLRRADLSGRPCSRSPTSSWSSRPEPGTRLSAPSSRRRRASSSTCSTSSRPAATPAPSSTAKPIQLSDPPTLKKQYKHDISVVVDRLVAGDDILSRLTDSLETALRPHRRPRLGQLRRRDGRRGVAELLREALLPERPPGAAHRDRTANLLVQRAVRRLPGVLRARHPDVGRRRPAARRPGAEPGRRCHPAVDHSRARACSTTSSAARGSRRRPRLLADTPWAKLPEDVREAILHGNNFTVTVRWKNRYGREVKYSTGFEGVIPYIERKYLEAETDSARQRYSHYLREINCPVCDGKRLKPEVLAVTVHDRSIADVCELSLVDAFAFIDELELTDARGEDRCRRCCVRSGRAWSSSSRSDSPT